jgi:hypothetical protein
VSLDAGVLLTVATFGIPPGSVARSLVVFTVFDRLSKNRLFLEASEEVPAIILAYFISKTASSVIADKHSRYRQSPDEVLERTMVPGSANFLIASTDP